MFELIIAFVKLILLVGGIFFVLGIVLDMAASSGKSESTGNSNKSRIVPLPTGTSNGGQTSVKKVQVRQPKEFEYALQFFVKFCASWGRSGDAKIYIEAYTQGEKKGTVTLCVCGENHWRGCVEDDIPELFDYIYGNQSSGYMSRGFSFYEPDCYIYGCRPESFAQYEVRENASNAYVESYNKLADRINYVIAFHEAEDDYAAYHQFVKWCKQCYYS